MSELGLVWIDGALVESDVARVSPLDRGLLTGDGVFETMRVYDRRIFAWDRHLDRLAQSAGALELSLPDRATLRAAADAVISAHPSGDGRLRITVTAGPAPIGNERAADGGTVIVAMGEAQPLPAPPVAVVVAPWTRNERGATAGLKTVSYAENVRALGYARMHGAAEAILANTRGELSEATGSNVFVVHDGVVRTPPADAGCLLGVTRAFVIDCCRDQGIPCREVALPMGALADADEVFLTSSLREVQAVASIDGVALPRAPGDVTARLQAALRSLVTSGRELTARNHGTTASS